MSAEKFDDGKAPVWRGFIKYFPRAILAVAGVSAYGAKKYGSYGGFNEVPDGFDRYSDGMMRHIIGEVKDPGGIDPESKLEHMAQDAWNAMGRLEIALQNREKAATAGAKTPQVTDHRCCGDGWYWSEKTKACWPVLPQRREEQMDPVAYGLYHWGEAIPRRADGTPVGDGGPMER